MAKKPDPVTVVTYSLLIIVNLLLHMVLSGVEVTGLFVQVFTELTGIFQSTWFVLRWLFINLISVTGIYIIGLVIAFEFLILPLMVRYKYLTIKPNLLLSFIFTIYLMLFARILAVVFG
ncbi:MAG: hypothetical protein WD266_11555 [Balneolales bacterium]